MPGEQTYEVVRKLGSGGFGAVYKVQRLSDRLFSAMKTEMSERDRRGKPKSGVLHLEVEF